MTQTCYPTKSCATCAHGTGEGTIRFCRVKGGWAFDASTTCDWHTDPGEDRLAHFAVTIENDGLTFEIFPNESFLIEDARKELAKCPGSLNVVVDVGAHVGTVALQAAKHGAFVYAVEPAPINIDMLKRNIMRNDLQDRVTVVEKAVASESGLSLPLRDEPLCPGQKSLAFNVGKQIGCDVETISLADLLAGITEKIDFLKMDIEGEEFVLSAGPPVPELSRVGFISISLHPPTNEDYFDGGDGRTQEEYYAAMVGWLKRSGVANARIDNHMAIGGITQ